MLILITPMLLRLLGISRLSFMIWVFPLPAAVAIFVSALMSGCSIDLNRILDFHTKNILLDDIESGKPD